MTPSPTNVAKKHLEKRAFFGLFVNLSDLLMSKVYLGTYEVLSAFADWLESLIETQPSEEEISKIVSGSMKFLQALPETIRPTIRRVSGKKNALVGVVVVASAAREAAKKSKAMSRVEMYTPTEWEVFVEIIRVPYDILTAPFIALSKFKPTKLLNLAKFWTPVLKNIESIARANTKPT